MKVVLVYNECMENINEKPCLKVSGSKESTIMVVICGNDDVSFLTESLKENVLLVSFSVNDWNSDFSPWPYHLNSRFDFSGNGDATLNWLMDAIEGLSADYPDIRKRIIEDDLIEGIVAMPTQLFYSVTIPVTLWFITKNKQQKGKTLFIDARKMGHMVDRKHRDFTDDDIQKLADTFESFQNGTLEDVKGFCSLATLEDIAKQDYILTPGRYVGIEEQEDDGEPFEQKMTRLTGELSELFAKSHDLEEEIRQKLGALGYEI